MNYTQLSPIPEASPIDSKTVSDRVYLWIKSAIINGDFKPGERIVQESLTQQLGVSRTPVRDALQRLNTEGLVTNVPFHGAVVFALSKKNLEEIYEVRILLETYAAQKACDLIGPKEIEGLEELSSRFQEQRSSLSKCMQYDRSFHSAICAAARSDYIIETLTSAWNKSDPYKSIYYTLPGNIEQTISEHRHMVECLKAGDKEGMGQAVSHHLRDVVEMISRHSKAFEGI